MDKHTFSQNLASAAELVLPFSQSLLIDVLPGEARFLIAPNASYDGNPLKGDEQVFPEDRAPLGSHLGPLTTDGVVEYLWRNGKVPEWINMSVHSYDLEFTYVELLCCGRYSALERHLYHRTEGRPPFHILSPSVPPGWKGPDESGKFRLHWQGEGTQSGSSESEA